MILIAETLRSNMKHTCSHPFIEFATSAEVLRRLPCETNCWAVILEDGFCEGVHRAVCILESDDSFITVLWKDCPELPVLRELMTRAGVRLFQYTHSPDGFLSLPDYSH